MNLSYRTSRNFSAMTRHIGVELLLRVHLRCGVFLWKRLLLHDELTKRRTEDSARRRSRVEKSAFPGVFDRDESRIAVSIAERRWLH